MFFVGSYTDPGGLEIVRKHCAEYIANRDGYPSNWNDIVLCGGASDGIRVTKHFFFSKFLLTISKKNTRYKEWQGNVSIKFNFI